MKVGDLVSKKQHVLWLKLDMPCLVLDVFVAGDEERERGWESYGLWPEGTPCFRGMDARGQLFLYAREYFEVVR